MSGLPSWAPILGAATGNPIWAILALQESENQRVAHGQLLASQARAQADAQTNLLRHLLLLSR